MEAHIQIGASANLLKIVTHPQRPCVFGTQGLWNFGIEALATFRAFEVGDGRTGQFSNLCRLNLRNGHD